MNRKHKYQLNKENDIQVASMLHPTNINEWMIVDKAMIHSFKVYSTA